MFSSNCDKTIVGDQNGSSDSDQKEVAPKKKKEGIGDKSKHISDKNNESNTEYEESSNKDTSSKTKLRRGKKHLRVKPGENQELEKVPTKITEDNAAKKIVEKQKITHLMKITMRMIQSNKFDKYDLYPEINKNQ